MLLVGVHFGVRSGTGKRAAVQVKSWNPTKGDLDEIT